MSRAVTSKVNSFFLFMEEVFKDIPGYEGIYQVSNLGRVKSLAREIKRKGISFCKEKMLKPGKNARYLFVVLSNGNIVKIKKVHQLVAMAFLGHKPDGTHKLVVDHINNNPLDNRLENLQIVTQRKNLSKDKKGLSKYTGVSWHKSSKKWISKIRINGKNIHLGLFNTELEASETYQNKLKILTL